MKKYIRNQTARAFILSSLLSCPFFGIFLVLPMILRKELDATPFAISTMTTLKPLSALLASYWSHSTLGKQHKVALGWAYLLKFLPFICIPFFSSPWLFIAAFGIHMLLLRGVIPSWMELLKQSTSQVERGKICAAGSTINYLCTAFMPLIFGWLLDAHPGSWRWLFPLTSILGMSSIWLILRMRHHEDEPPLRKKEGFKAFMSKPWQHAHTLLLERPDFFQFQIGFFLGGAGLMTIHAVIPEYMADTLKLSYTKIFFAICFCKGIGFALASPLWVKFFNRSEIFAFSSRIPLLAVLFPILLMLTRYNPALIFLAYFLYGVMQAGSELGWKMSGPIFAGEEDSAPFSLINVLAVGVRGVIFPYFGALCLVAGGPSLAFLFGGLFCLAGSMQLWRAGKTHPLPMHT